MKRILFIIVILLISQVCFAGRLQEMQKAVIAAKNGAGGESIYTIYLTDNTTDFNNVTYSESIVYSGTDDNYIRGSNPTANHGSSDPLQIGYWSEVDRTHILIRFTGLSGIPNTATVKSVTLALYYVAWDSSVNMEIHKVSKLWTENYSSYNSYDTSLDWTTSGALDATDSNATSSGTLVSADGWNTITQTTGYLLNDVQSWISESSVNNGWMLYTSSGGVNYRASEGTDGYRPYLKVVYEN